MKKLIYAISALAIVLAVGCSEDKVQTPEREYKLVVNMDKASLGDTTRAPRNSWENGDEVMLFFGADCTEGKWLIIKYQDGVWGIKDRANFDESGYISELAERDDKSLAAVYCSTPGDLHSYNKNGRMYLGRVESNPYGMLIMTCEDGSYSVDEELSTFTINATLSLPDTGYGQYVQFTIRNISKDDNWMLEAWGCPLFSCVNFVLSCDVNDKLNIDYQVRQSGFALQGYNGDDGVVFYGVLPNNVSGTKQNYNFILTNSSGSAWYQKTFENKTLTAGSAVIFNGPAYGNNHGWQQE